MRVILETDETSIITNPVIWGMKQNKKKRIFHSIGFGNRMIFNKPKKKVFEQKEPQNERTKTGKK